MSVLMVRFSTIASPTLSRCHFAQMTALMSFSMFPAIVESERAHGSPGPMSLPSKRGVLCWESVYNSRISPPRTASSFGRPSQQSRFRRRLISLRTNKGITIGKAIEKSLQEQGIDWREEE